MESPESDSLENLVNKFCEARIVLEKLGYQREDFAQAKSILEIGAGQGWASCIVKKIFPSNK